ncbi:MAG: hypothetical protein F9K40_16045 [Kofleriaceae bacterium]|nr:MAG: hypothetical protein F9K40_16045 [Kofleriaceae bacterium]MBZ0234612.1 hypothetical protein [Kofleriaceae bacterium]
MTLRAFLCSLVVLAGCASANVNGGADATEDASDTTDAAVEIDAAACARTPCDILSQCGCESNATTPVCDLDFNQLPVGATKCRASTLDGTETSTCSATTTCGPLHVCVGGRCRKYCDDNDDCAGPGGLCLIDLTYGNPPMNIPMAPKTCTTDCNPTAVTNATCPASWACHIYFDDPDSMTMGDERYLTDCEPQGGGGLDAACTGNRSCNAGLDCVTFSSGGSRCRPTCICPNGNCAGGSCPMLNSGSCRDYTTAPVIGGVTYGACY